MEPLKSRQISEEKKLVLEALAKTVTRPGVKFLEVGSWLGESTLVLGEIAKQYSGYLYCVDWWKGNIGTELKNIAKKKDIFSFFWKRICEAGLEEVVVPIRARSDVAVEIFKPETFDMVFIDADHRYECILQDIENYGPLVKTDGGVFCGDDCEGYISDFYKKFLNQGKNVDSHETIHCGVVLAVGTMIKNYSLHYNIWSAVRGGRDLPWTPMQLSIPGLPEKKQEPPPCFAFTKNYHIFRYQKKVFAIPNFIKDFDFTDNSHPLPPEVVVKRSLDEIELSISEKVDLIGNYPTLLATYKNYNIVSHDNIIYAILQSIGPTDLHNLNQAIINEHITTQKILVGDDLNEVKELINLITPKLVQANYKSYNIFLYNKKYFGISKSLGRIENWKEFTSNINDLNPLDCLFAESIETVVALIDRVALANDSIKNK